MDTIRNVPDRSDAFRRPSTDGSIFKRHGHRSVLLHDLVCPEFSGDDLLWRQRRRSKFDGRGDRAHVETESRDVIQVDEHGGEEVLTGVLLHVVESATPIDLALDLRQRKRLLEDVNDPPILIDTSATVSPPTRPVSCG